MALFSRSALILISKLLGVWMIFLLERAVGIPLFSCYFLLTLAPNLKQPGWFMTYIIVSSLFFSSLLSLTWLLVFIGFSLVLLIAQYFGRRKIDLLVSWLAVISSGVLFILANGVFSAGTLIYWSFALCSLVIINRQHWLSTTHFQTWYIR